MIKVELLGEKQILAAFKGLPYAFTDSLVQRANAKAAVPLQNRMHLLAPVGKTGNLADSIGIVKSGKGNRGDLGTVAVGPRGGKFKGNIAPIIEFGTRMRVNKKGANRGKVTPNPFVEKSLVQTGTEVQKRQGIELEHITINFLRKTLR